jgi:hypothetical protein
MSWLVLLFLIKVNTRILELQIDDIQNEIIINQISLVFKISILYCKSNKLLLILKSVKLLLLFN